MPPTSTTLYLCVCRRCLQYSDDGQYHAQKRTVREHIRRYGTNDTVTDARNPVSPRSGRRRLPYTDTEVQSSLQRLVGHRDDEARLGDGQRALASTPQGFLANRLQAVLLSQGLELSAGSDNSIDSDVPEQFYDDRNEDTGINDFVMGNTGESSPETPDEDLSLFEQPDPGCLQELENESSDSDSEDSVVDRSHETTDAAEATPSGSAPTYHVEDIQVARKFIDALQAASLDDLDADMRHQLENPSQTQPSISPSEQFSLETFLAVTNASEETYNLVRQAYERRHPNEEMLSHYKIKRLVQSLSGVVPVINDMCYKSCTAFTGPFASLDICPLCGEPRYTTPGGTIARKQFYTIPIGPQLQALWRSPSGAELMQYRRTYTAGIRKELKQNGGRRTSPYRDFFDGQGYLDALREKRILDDDMVIMLSIDGAQLYRMKASDCWIYIWVILDLDPAVRYQKRHVLPGGVIPGPNKPKNLDSYLLPGLIHLAVAQKHGLGIWDGLRCCKFTSRPFFAFGTADGPAMAAISGCVGHHGRCGCRLYCPLIGRHKPGAAHYYPVLLKPVDFLVAGCDHPDVDLVNLLRNFNAASATDRYATNLTLVESSKNKAQYERNRLETGICRASLFLGLPEARTLGVPAMFPGDNMHLPCLNITDLFLPLWRGTLDCERTDSRSTWDWIVLVGETWKQHGAEVAATTSYIPGSFDRPPRNPAEKISSGYKAWEFLLYFYGLGPALLCGILPTQYYRHFCKLVRGVRLMLQEEIPVSDVREADCLLTEFAIEFERLYVQRRTDRIHFVRQSIHAVVHMPHETIRCGPGKIYSQWVIERTIGNLGEEIRQHSNAFSNLTQRAVRRCQVNAIKSMIPNLDADSQGFRLPRKAIDLGHGLVLLPACDTAARAVRAGELEQIQIYLTRRGVPSSHLQALKVVRWARLQLRNGQIARSQWKESRKALDRLRCARHIKIVTTTDTPFRIAEVLYFMLFDIQDKQHACAMVSYFGSPDQDLLELSYNTYWTAQKLGDSGLAVIPVTAIESVVMMAPNSRHTHSDYWYLMEKPGLASFQALEESTIDEEDPS